MRKTIIFSLCAAMILFATACQGGANKETDKDAELANPYVDCSTMADAAKIAGFDMEVPEDIDGYTEKTIQAVDNEMIQVIYGPGENKICIRKALGSGDISGDYNTYDDESMITAGDLQVKAKGNDGALHVLTWTSGAYTFAINCDEGVDKDFAAELVQSVK